MKSNEIDMTTGSLPKKILMYSVPLMLSNVLQVMFALFDGEGDVVVGGDGGGSHAVELGAVFHFDVCHVPLRFLVWRPCRFCLLFLIYD